MSQPLKTIFSFIFVESNDQMMMIRNFKPQLRFSFIYNQPNVSLTVFPNSMTEQSGNEYISSLCKKNLYKEALRAFDFLEKNTSFKIKLSTYAHLICACSSLRSLEHGKKIHNHVLTSNQQPDIILLNHILNMYGKCGSLKNARKVFNEMPEKNVISWTSVIAGYAQHGQDKDAVKFYLQMLQSGFVPDQFTFGSTVKACSGMDDVGLGRQLHAHVIKSECGSQLIAMNALVAMYSKFDQIVDAWNVFSSITKKDLISWGSMIAGFGQLGYEIQALHLLKEMLSQGAYQPNEFIFGSAFSSCTGLLQPECGRQIHGMCIKYGLGKNNFAGCALCDMYARSGLLDYARVAFYQIERPDLASWNAIIGGIANGSDANEAMAFFSQMRHLGLIPDNVTVRSLLSACPSASALYQGMQIHSFITKMGYILNVSVCNALLTMYAKCSNLCDALNVFEEVRNNADSVSWNAILTACMQHHHAEEVFRLLKLMLISQNKPDHITLGNVLGACVEITSLEMGNQVHCYTIKTGLTLETSIMNGLIDMYTKCGSLERARNLFGIMENPDVVSWSCLIVAYAQFGYGEEALELFRRMINLSVKPNEVTFLGVLTACSHVGRVQEGWQLYKNMESEYGIVPTREHSSCVVDLLARAGCLHEAESLINQMAFDPDIVVWKTLLAACKTHGNVEIGKRAVENILKIDPSNSAALVLLCNIHASSGSWEDVARLRSLMKERSVTKVPGQSWIEVKGRIHMFYAEDTMHPERDKIYMTLEELWLQMLDYGYAVYQK